MRRSVTIAYEVLIPMPHILLMGGGHCAKSIANLIPALGWSHSVHDTRNDYSNHDLYPDAKELHCNLVSEFFKNEDVDSISRFSDVLLLGHDWAEDEERLISILKLIESGAKSLRVGVIGSKSKWRAFKQSCIENGISEQTLANVRCPSELMLVLNHQMRLLLQSLLKSWHATKELKLQNLTGDRRWIFENFIFVRF